MKTLSIKTMKKFIDTNSANGRIDFGIVRTAKNFIGNLTGNKRKKDLYDESDDDDFGNESDDEMFNGKSDDDNFSNYKAGNSKSRRRNIVPDDSDNDDELDGKM